MRALALAAVAAALLGLAACERASTTARARTDDDRGPASAPARDGGGYDRGGSSGGGYADRGGDGEGSRRDDGGYRSGRASREPTPQFKGEPLWSDNRRYTAEENAQYHCGRSGPDIGASGYEDCLTKVHAFIDHPPAGVETLTRANGDRLLYDPHANLFVVARKDGAPRTFFKPRTGASYWTEQKTREANGGGYGRGGGGSRGGGGDEGSGA